jgi:ribosomal protein S18 acetylase RimI-like enzyme
LELACAAADGNPNPIAEAAFLEKVGRGGADADTLCAADADGNLAAWAWVSFDDGFAHERRAYLQGGVRLDLRRKGLGSHLLAWTESRARQVYAAVPDARPLVMRIDVYHENPDAFSFFERRGFHFALAEDELRRDLSQSIPASPLPEGMTFVPWTEENTGEFFRAYQDAFSTRPGFPGWTEEVWRRAFTGGDDFRADLSLLLLDGAEPVGYAVCAVEGEEGWIVQVGVRPAWRRRGLAGALLSETMRRFQREGLRAAMLDVNVNNPRAMSVYRRLGFERLWRCTSHRKTVEASR